MAFIGVSVFMYPQQNEAANFGLIERWNTNC